MFRFSPKSRLTVRTQSGTQLGKVATIEVDELTGRVATFLVAGTGVLSVLAEQALAISWDQVIEWQDSEIIVADAFERQGATNLAVASPAAPSVQMSERQ